MKQAFAALLLMTAGVSAGVSAPAFAQAAAASPAQQKAAADFIAGLSEQAFAVLRDKNLTRAEGRSKFRTLLRANFDLEGTGMRLIRSYRSPASTIKLTDAQVQAYRAALPDFLVNTYSDRLYDFASSKVNVVRTTPRGNRGDVDVVTRITDPKGGAPIEAIWQVKASAKPVVSNIVVNGVNIALTQEADFKSYIERHGFDALVDFMKRAK